LGFFLARRKTGRLRAYLFALSSGSLLINSLQGGIQVSLRKRKLQKYLRGLVLRRYKLLGGKKTISMADTKGVLASYYFDVVEIKTGKKVKLRVDTFYFLGEDQATPEEIWYSLGGR